MVRIQQITDTRRKGILFYISHLADHLTKIDNASNTVDISNWTEINFAKKHDLSNFHFSNSTRRILLTLPLFCSRVKIITVHDVIPRTKNVPLPLTKLVYRYLNLFSDAFIVHSEHAKALLLLTAPFVPDGSIYVIPHGCSILEEYDINILRSKYGFSKDEIIFTMIGALKKAKGQVDVIKTFSKLSLENSKLVIIGKAVDNISKAELQNLNDENIVYLGFLEDEVMMDYIKLSNALISYRLESVGDSSGPVAIAVGAGKPIICSSVGALPEIVNDAGMVAKDLNELKECIVTFCNNEQVRAELTSNAEINREKYSWENISMKQLQLYSQLL
ncbi:glycosyltransferase family 4 protein [Methanosarcina sp. UBA411]|uniref:glycosyltransferase family 4 protein n=1 Tax=Methanosarcina sp. UBA411 TaxID=1915589 RepID=UPI0025E35E17|nr:glycosyltransferase family 4 protein [Methanosarcina sp. UBA411]